MESYIPISYLNDFIFCPRSIYYHQLYQQFEVSTYNQKPQIAGTAAHNTIDKKTYSSKKTVLQGFELYIEQYRIHGKIDVFDTVTGILTERKNNIKKIYDGYVFQVYAHFFGLIELGYSVKKIVIHDLTRYKNFLIPLPMQDEKMFRKFEETIFALNNFSLDDNFEPELKKCEQCIYRNLCDKSLC